MHYTTCVMGVKSYNSSFSPMKLQGTPHKSTAVVAPSVCLSLDCHVYSASKPPSRGSHEISGGITRHMVANERIQVFSTHSNSCVTTDVTQNYCLLTLVSRSTSLLNRFAAKPLGISRLKSEHINHRWIASDNSPTSSECEI